MDKVENIDLIEVDPEERREFLAYEESRKDEYYKVIQRECKVRLGLDLATNQDLLQELQKRGAVIFDSPEIIESNQELLYKWEEGVKGWKD